MTEDARDCCKRKRIDQDASDDEDETWEEEYNGYIDSQSSHTVSYPFQAI